LAACIITGCATSIPVSVTDPARLNMSGITRIAILPFKTSSTAELQGTTSAAIAAFLEQQLSSTGRFEIVSADGLDQSKDRSSIADAVIEGQIINLAVNDTSTNKTRQVKDKEGKVVNVPYTQYDRKLTLNFSYKITRTRDNSIVRGGSETKSQVLTDSDENKANLTDSFELVQRAIKSTLGKVASDVAPTTRTVNRTLAKLTKEEAKNKELKQQMSDADKRVKARDYEAAIAMYGSIYAGGTFAAGYNQAVLTEATDGVDAAIVLMSDLVQKTKNPQAVSMLASLKSAKSGAQTAAAQVAAGKPLIEVAVDTVSQELTANLPKNSRITLAGARGNTDLDYVIGEVTQNLANDGITVVDRQNQNFINAEKQFQLSGDVSDATAVSFGKALGLTSTVFCSIDGTGNRRSLRVRAVDIETGKVIYTNSFDI
jgi:hypothetical protein